MAKRKSATGKVNAETLALILNSAYDSRNELLQDRSKLKQGIQLNLTTSGVILGLVINMIQSPLNAQLTILEPQLIARATVLLIYGALVSLLYLFPRTKKTGYIKPLTLYEKYALLPPLDMQLNQLSHWIREIEDIQNDLKQFGCGSNIARISIVFAIVFIGASVLL
jgi:hypothetical protein